MGTSAKSSRTTRADRPAVDGIPEPDIPPPLSGREYERIKVLRQYAVLDTEPEEEFDDLAAMAAHVCGTPIALISLVDIDRQWFKSKIGLTASETPRSHSFCAHALDRPDDVLVVPDAARDERFFQNPLVTGEPGIRFYAGAPLRTTDGLALGTICVIDRVARELNPTQQWMLRTLARQVMLKLESRLLNLNIRHSEVLPAGLHDLTLEQFQAVVCTSPARWALWLRLLSFLARPILDDRFAFAYIGGTFLSNQIEPEDVKVTLETAEPFASCGFAPLEGYVQDGLERISQMYSVQLRFWIKDQPPEQTGYEAFLSAGPPWAGADDPLTKVVRLNLRDRANIAQFRIAMDPFCTYDQ